MKKTIVVIGKGYIGNYLVPILKEDGHIVHHFSKKELDYTDPNNFERWVKTYHAASFGITVDWVINCTGFTGTPNVDGCEDHKEDCYKYNVTVPLQLTKSCNKLNIPIIHIGSGCVYSGYDRIYSEDDLTDFGSDTYNSSFYSKTKDAFEKLSSHMNRYIFRIRIPFNGIVERKNYLFKLLNYDNIISKQNSITCVDDLLVFIKKFVISPKQLIPKDGIFNVVNTGSVDAFDVVDILARYGITNPKWKYVSLKEANFRVDRSNCILSTEKIEKLGLALPNVRESLEKSIARFAEEYEIKKIYGNV